MKVTASARNNDGQPEISARFVSSCNSASGCRSLSHCLDKLVSSTPWSKSQIWSPYYPSLFPAVDRIVIAVVCRDAYISELAVMEYLKFASKFRPRLRSCWDKTTSGFGFITTSSFHRGISHLHAYSFFELAVRQKTRFAVEFWSCMS